MSLILEGIKSCFLLERKAMTNVDSILKKAEMEGVKMAEE